MLNTATSINDKAKSISSVDVTVDTQRIGHPNVVQFQGANMIKKWQMTSWIEEVFHTRTMIRNVLQQQDVSVDEDIAPSGWFEKQLILKGASGRTMFFLQLFAGFLLIHLLFFAIVLGQ